MDVETLRILESLRQALVFFLEALRSEQEKVYLLSVSVQSLLDAVKDHDPDLFQKYEEFYKCLAHGPILDSHVQERVSIDEALAKLKQIQKVN